MSRKILYFINPISGTQGKNLLITKIREKTTAQNIPFEILNTNADGNYYFLRDKIAHDGLTDIVVCGGDGTVNQVAATLLNEDIKIGIIPMGSGNGLALAAKIPKDIDKALDLVFTGKARYVDSFFINAQFSCMLCGIGFDAQVAHDFAQQPKRGLASYIRQTLTNFINARTYTFELINKGKSFSAEAYFISIANSNQFGNHFTIAPQASLEDGLLDIIVVKKMSKLRMMWAVIKQVRNGKIKDVDEKTFHDKDVLYFQTEKLMIHNLDAAPLHIDGDPAHTSKKFIIEIIPSAFKLIQPQTVSV